MHSLDLLSESPKYFIFQKGANKTNLGGVLFMIYIIIIMCISFVYLYDYFTGETYNVESSLIEDVIDESKQNEELLENNKINPVKIFLIELYHFNGTKLSKNFIVKDANTKEIIDRGSPFKRRISDFALRIEYICEDDYCSRRKEDEIYLYYYAKIAYSGFKVDHQSKDSPIKNDPNIYFLSRYPFFFYHPMLRKIYWEHIRYKEEKSGFLKLYNDFIGKEDIFYAGQFSTNSESYVLEDGYTFGNETRLLGIINLDNAVDKYREYKRKKVSRLDVLANIGALSSTIYGILVKCFALIYSKNFDNYKIIDKILSQKLKVNYNENKVKNKKEIELSVNDFNNSMNDEFYLENNLIINDADNNSNYNTNNYNNNYNINNMEPNSTLPRLRFFDFFLNNIYNNKCCYKSNKQELLSICNKILYRYISIDYVLYNQIKLENLFKDYKWNNPKLNDVENNDLIIALKNYI